MKDCVSWASAAIIISIHHDQDHINHLVSFTVFWKKNYPSYQHYVVRPVAHQCTWYLNLPVPGKTTTSKTGKPLISSTKIHNLPIKLLLLSTPSHNGVPCTNWNFTVIFLLWTDFCENGQLWISPTRVLQVEKSERNHLGMGKGADRLLWQMADVRTHYIYIV